ncbi:trehalose-6-phosphate synthase [bacterium]
MEVGQLWTKKDLQKLVKDNLGDYEFIVVSNRQPYIHTLKKSKIVCKRGAGGLITALDPVMKACDGLWVAVSNGDADRRVTDDKGCIRVPEEDPSYTLKRIWLTKEEEKGYYYGYSNEVMWPLCHMTYQRPVFKEQDWEYYKKVNKKFAEAVIEEIGDKKAFVWIQDYHLCLLPKYLKEMSKNHIIVAHFWHIPWPNHETFRICPQKHEILEGLLANDFLGFHISYHCNNFLDVIDREMESKIDRENLSITRNNHETLIRANPISVDFEGITNLIPDKKQLKDEEAFLREEYNLDGFRVMIGIDRIDYTKGLPERFLAIDRLLEKHPEFIEKVVFLEIGGISRIHIQKYKELNDELNALVEQINWKHSTENWKPITFIREHLNFSQILALYRLSDVCIVSSLHDGMNLVAKEFVSSRADEDGVLVLSQFTGASRELTDAISINPYDREAFGDAVNEALTMDKKERRRRMKRMRKIVNNQNIFSWSAKIISELLKIEF